MKNIIIFAVVFLAAFTMKSQEKKAVVSFKNEIINYGKIKKGSNGVRFFEFTNTGTAPLIFESAEGSCGCTVPTLPIKPIMPGKKGKLKVNYDTKRLGRFSKSVTIVTNASKEPKIIRIKGEVLSESDFLENIKK